MAMEFNEYLSTFVKIVKDNNIDKQKLGSIVIGLSVGDSLSGYSDEKSNVRAKFTIDMLTSRTDDINWDNLVHTLGIDNSKSKGEVVHIDRIKKKRILCDALTLYGLTHESPNYLTKSASILQSYVDTKLSIKYDSELGENEDSVDAQLKGFITESKSTDSGITKAYESIIEFLSEHNCDEDYKFNNTLYLSQKLYDLTSKTKLSGYELETENNKQTDEALIKGIDELNEAFITHIHELCNKNPKYQLLLLTKYIDDEDRINIYVTSRTKLVRLYGSSFMDVLNTISTLTEVRNSHNDYNKLSESAINLAKVLYID